ncbi:MAG: response regulator, partial [Planctomycetales bacterium]|nr:response regulator [Planctomycetales bacterium]
MSISLLVADDHQVVRMGLKNILEGTGVVVAAEATSGEEVLQKVAAEKPDVVLMDVR